MIIPTVFQCVVRRKEADRTSFPSRMLFGSDGARKEEREGCVSFPSSLRSTLTGKSCSDTGDSRCN
jgi:hypothetical protein